MSEMKLYATAALYSMVMVGSFGALLGVICAVLWFGGIGWMLAFCVGGLLVIYYFNALKYLRENSVEDEENEAEPTENV
jgi:uncharacterized membrane protein